MRHAAVLAASMIAAAVPVAAQVPPAMAAEGNPHGNPMFAGMSEAGRAAMRMALRGADPAADRAATDAARDRMLAVLDADRLDVPALRRAMDDEREAANVAKAHHQAAMIAGLQQLSLADRKIFVANAQAMRARIDSKMAGRRGGGMMPPPQ